jgi:diaminopimelate decarboxylase
MECNADHRNHDEVSSGGASIAFSIAPALGEECKTLLDMSEECQALLRCYGSPLNVVFPERIDRNAQELIETFQHYHINGKIYCTTKPNRSTAILRHIAQRIDLGVDVSSEGSLQAALSAGVAAQRLEATGPKSKAYLTLSLLHGIVVNVDDITEIDRILEIRRGLNLKGKVSILVRLSGFSIGGKHHSEGDGTFGVAVRELPDLFDRLEKIKSEVHLCGFAFHLNTDSVAYRVSAMEECLRALFEARNRGFSPHIVNLGGGLRIRYAADDQEWTQFLVRLKSSLVGDAEVCTWNRSGLGFSVDSKGIRGAPRFMDHAVPLSPADQLCSVLRQSLPSFSGITAAQLFSEALIDVWIEPGRAILDQVGITFGRVLTVRRTERGVPLIVLEMNRSNINAFELSLLTDPVLIPSLAYELSSPMSYFLTGNLCVANELLTPRMIHFRRPVIPGDILAFCNTAPYIMDFAESRTLHQPVARKIAGYFEGKKLTWSLDDEYQPRARANL